MQNTAASAPKYRVELGSVFNPGWQVIEVVSVEPSIERVRVTFDSTSEGHSEALGFLTDLIIHDQEVEANT